MYGYNADVYAFGGDKSASSDMIHQHAQTMVTNLSLERKSEERAECPIIWVAHSLGGILLKRVGLILFIISVSVYLKPNFSFGAITDCNSRHLN